MKPDRRFAILVLVACLARPLQAQVVNFSLFKVTVYHQTSVAPPAAPDAPNAYYLGVQLNSIDSPGFADVTFSDPPGDSYVLAPLTSDYFNYGSPYFSAKADLDAMFPSGEYDFQVDYTNAAFDTGALIVPDYDLYATNAAAFTTNCWAAMQHVDPAADFVLAWNAFSQQPYTTAAFSFVDIFSEITGEAPFSADFVTPDTTTTNIPANTLKYGQTYRVNVFFSNRQDTQNAGFGNALGTVGFDNLTYTTLVTVPPRLSISAANNEVLITWPALAANFALQSTAQLPAVGAWSTVTNLATNSGGANCLLLPATGQSMFFRLISR